MSALSAVHSYLLFWVFILLIIGLLLYTQLARKGYMMCCGLYYLLTSQDKKCSQDNSLNTHHINARNVQSTTTKRLILIRHAQSVWNEVFNAKILSVSFPWRIIKVLLKELLLCFSADSYLFDSPLSDLGIEQCRDLRSFLRADTLTKPLHEFDVDELIGIDIEENVVFNAQSHQHVTECIDILNGSNTATRTHCKSLIVSSPLRRCIETVALSLFDRLQSNKEEKIHVVSSLQELTRNIDGLSLSVDNTELPPISRQMQKRNDTDWMQWFAQKLELSLKDGVKSRYQRGDDRISEFVKWVFCDRNAEYDSVVVCGHSLWIRMFFRLLLPSNEEHEATHNKLQNAGVVSLRLTQYSLHDGGTQYRIDADSICLIFKGFESRPHNKRK